ncbi:HD domain-containing protein [Terrabacter carboxydivorans]|uniref:HDIG domain-containing protein n=1 Tax=Terrabacter carboxydivorans TaxID=619730 RepID=A0ABN3M747_9MICO
MWSESAAEDLAREWISGSGSRWAHLSAVGRLAQETNALGTSMSSTVVQAAWVHDIGYAPGLRDTGMHAIDGARALLRFGAPVDVVALVAHHTGAIYEAAARGFAEELAELPLPDHTDLDALTLLDLVVGPEGDLTTAEDRIAEILSRYRVGDPVHRAVTRSGPELLASAGRARTRLQLSDEWPFGVAESVLEA